MHAFAFTEFYPLEDVDTVIGNLFKLFSCDLHSIIDVGFKFDIISNICKFAVTMSL